jgi:hypothetical protein
MRVLEENSLAALIEKILTPSVGVITLPDGVSGASTLTKSAAGTVCCSLQLATTINVPPDTLVATLPEGFRPQNTLYFPATAIWQDYNTGMAFLRIEPNGNIYASGYYTWGGAESSPLNALYAGFSFNL